MPKRHARIEVQNLRLFTTGRNSICKSTDLNRLLKLLFVGFNIHIGFLFWRDVQANEIPWPFKLGVSQMGELSLVLINLHVAFYIIIMVLGMSL